MRTFTIKSLLFILILLPGVKIAQAQWQQINPVNPVSISRQTTFVINDTAYMGNGDSPSPTYTNKFYGYTSASNTWWPVRTFPGGGGDMGFNFVINNQAYLGGGAGPGYENGFFQYDPHAGWTSKGVLPDGISTAFNAGFSIGNKGFFGTGAITSGVGTPVTFFYEYDPSNGPNGTWTKKADFPGSPRYGCAAFAINGKGYIGLGFNSTPGVAFNDMFEYDTIAGWRQMATMPVTFGQGEPTYFVQCGKLIVTLGDTSHRQEITPQTWVFDPSSGTSGAWYRLPDFTGTPAYSMQGVILQDTAYVMGGNRPSQYLNQMYRYVPTLDILSITPTQNICAGGNVTLTVNGSSAYKWTPTGNLSDSITYSTLTPGGKTQTVASPSVSTTYTVTDVVCGHTATVMVNISNGIPLAPVAHPSSICGGQSSTITVAGGGTYTWSPSVNSNANGDTVTVSPLTTITYIVTSAGGGSCADTGSVVLTVGNSTTGGIITAARDTICSGTPGSLLLAGNSSDSIRWQISTTDTNSFVNIGTTASMDTTKYRTDPLTQSTWFRAIVGIGSCTAASNSLQLIVPPTLTASFTSTTAGKTVTFNSGGSIGNINNYFWDFGDGNTSNDSNPVYTYAKDTIYNPCLTIYDGSNCSYTFCRTVALGIPTISADGSWLIYPNPFSNELNIDTKTFNSRVQSLQVYDVLGRVVVNELPGSNSNSSFHLNTSSLSNGMYYLMIKTAEVNYVQKVVKQ